MTKPRRIQRKRTRGWRMPPNTVYVGRPTKWGNPFGPMFSLNKERQPVARLRQAEVEMFRRWLRGTTKGQALAEAARRELRGKNLCCWCAPDEPWCHADVLLKLANEKEALWQRR